MLLYISGWREDTFSQAHRIKGEVGRTGFSVLMLPEARLQGLYQTERTSENLYYEFMPSSAGLLNVEDVHQRFKVKVRLKISRLERRQTNVMNDKSKVKPDKTDCASEKPTVHSGNHLMTSQISLESKYNETVSIK